MENKDVIGLEMDEGAEARSSKTILSRSLSKVSNVTYSAKKTMAQGLMDISLLTANANQLRYIIEFRHDNPTNFVILLVLIVCSLILQVIVGTMLIFKERMRCCGANGGENATNVDVVQLNNYAVLGVFLITVINIFIAAFTIAST